MKKPSYRRAIQWIADNDEPGEFDQQTTSELISVVLMADLCEVDPMKVAADVIKLRFKRDGHNCSTCSAPCGDKPKVTCPACSEGNE